MAAAAGAQEVPAVFEYLQNLGNEGPPPEPAPAPPGALQAPYVERLYHIAPTDLDLHVERYYTTRRGDSRHSIEHGGWVARGACMPMYQNGLPVGYVTDLVYCPPHSKRAAPGYKIQEFARTKIIKGQPQDVICKVVSLPTQFRPFAKLGNFFSRCMHELKKLRRKVAMMLLIAAVGFAGVAIYREYQLQQPTFLERICGVVIWGRHSRIEEEIGAAVAVIILSAFLLIK